jgi:GrpB-like predicted nucleotidyltransferase (UPF0157 family)
MLDGDFIGAVHPFEIYDPGRIEYLYQTLYLLVDHHRRHGYPHFVINYVFEEAQSLNRLRSLLMELDDVIYAFRLVCNPQEAERRIRQRCQSAGLDAKRLAWEISRAAQLAEIQRTAALHGDLGYAIDTSGLGIQQTAQAIWDVIHERITLVAYRPEWEQLFRAEKERVQLALGELALNIHHIGSTSVPGLSAKPVIDLMVEIPDIEHASACIPPLQALGYAFIDHPENIDRRFFRKGSPRSYHLHLVQQNSQALQDHLDFREALRTDVALRQRYQLLKEELADRFSSERKAYTDHKGDFVVTALQAYRSERH